MEKQELKVKMSYCPECGNTISVAADNMMTQKERNKFMKDASKDNLDVKTITLEEFKSKDYKWYCEDTCKNFKP